jgi:DNA-binding NarL/FixJ family response regulator
MQPQAAALALAQESTSPAPLRVLIADDHPLFAEAIAITLEADKRIEIVGFAQDGKEAIELVSELRPDIVLMDLNMPVVDGFEATRRLTKVCPESKIVVVTAATEPDDSQRALEAGASAYLRKGCYAADLFQTIFSVASLKEARSEPPPDRSEQPRATRLRKLAAKATRARLALR